VPHSEPTPGDAPPVRHRAWMEERFGPLGSGRMDLAVNDASYDLFGLLHVLGLDFEDVRPIDAHILASGRYAIRYFDPEERGIVVYEFDAGFRRLDETFVHIAEWVEEG
jgi:hypothetical protein